MPTRIQAPNSFLFFVVAKDGPHDSYRPVAVALCQGRRDRVLIHYNHQVARYCLQCINVLSDPGNRIAIQAELALAVDFYKNDKEGVLLPRIRLPDFRWNDTPELEAKRIRAYDRSLSQFPFIATCLQLGIGYNQANGSEDEVRKEPLGTLYYDDTHEYGMVVIDISDLYEIRYGLVGFGVGVSNRVFGSAEPRGLPPTLEEHRPRRPMSANEYMTKFIRDWSSGVPNPISDVVNELQEHPLITVSAMDFIWPADADGDAVAATQALSKIRLVSSDRRHPSEEAITSLVEGIFKTQSFDVSLIDKLRTLPDFRVIFCRHLRKRLEEKQFLHPNVLGRLLGIAFDSQQYLDWVLFKGLPTDAIATALGMPELREANSISLCIDTIYGTHKQLLEALSKSTSLRELYLLQEPTRESDNASSELFLELLSTSHLDLSRYKILLTGPFSSSLSKKLWLPTTNCKLDVRAFPVEHMFARHQITGSNPACFSPHYFYLGDALLKPKRFAAGFLQYLQSLIATDWRIDPQLYSFACAPSTIADSFGKEVSPIPAENFTIPLRPMKWDIERSIYAGKPFERGNDIVFPECWAKVRDLVSGSWVVLVSKEEYRDLEAIRTWDHNIFPPKPILASFVKYAFLRLKTHVPVEKIPENLGPEMVEVGGLKEFLLATALEVDPDLVDQRLKEVWLYISTAPEQVALGPGLEWLSVLEPYEACDILKDFLEDSAYVNENLRLAMTDNPEGRNWYPELLRGDDQGDANLGGSAKREHARNEEIFFVPL